jgi:hypothetical protein
VSTAAPVDPRRFYLDFVAQLNRRRPRPSYPEPPWWKALQIADLHDQFRTTARLNARDDGSYFERQRTYLLRHSDSAVNFQTSFPRMDENPAPRFEDGRGRHVSKQSEQRSQTSKH